MTKVKEWTKEELLDEYGNALGQASRYESRHEDEPKIGDIREEIFRRLTPEPTGDVAELIYRLTIEIPNFQSNLIAIDKANRLSAAFANHERKFATLQASESELRGLVRELLENNTIALGADIIVTSINVGHSSEREIINCTWCNTEYPPGAEIGDRLCTNQKCPAVRARKREEK